MKTIKNIFKTGVVVAFVAAIGFSCDYDRPASNPVNDTSTSEAIVAMDSSAANLSNPRPAPIGDTSVTAEQADRFGTHMGPNQDSAARAQHRLDEIKRKQKQIQ